MERISSRQNAVVQRFRDVARGGSGPSVLIDGEHLLDEALRSSIPIEVVAIADRIAETRAAALAAQAARSGARTIVVSDAVLAAISPVRHPSGIVAIARRPRTSVADALGGAPQRLLVLVEVQDPGNVGAIVRAAEACGATGVIGTQGTADPFGWKALRGGMGSTFRVPIGSGATLDETIVAIRDARVRIAATVPRDGTPLPSADLREPFALFLGAEGAGLPRHVVDAADLRITIPMRAPVESLNVAIAAALVLYEATRQQI